MTGHAPQVGGHPAGPGGESGSGPAQPDRGRPHRSRGCGGGQPPRTPSADPAGQHRKHREDQRGLGEQQLREHRGHADGGG